MGTTELLEDPEYTSESGAPLKPAELNMIFDRIFKTRTREEWMADFLANQLMFAPIQRIMNVENDPQALLNGYVRPGNYPGLGEIGVPGYPVYFSECQPGIRTRSAHKGEQTDEIMMELGFDAEAIESLKNEGVIE